MKASSSTARPMRTGLLPYLIFNNLDAVTAAIVPYMLFCCSWRRSDDGKSTTKGNAPIGRQKAIHLVKQLAGKNVGTPGIGTSTTQSLATSRRARASKSTTCPRRLRCPPIMIEKGKLKLSRLGAGIRGGNCAGTGPAFTTYSSCPRFRMPKALSCLPACLHREIPT